MPNDLSYEAAYEADQAERDAQAAQQVERAAEDEHRATIHAMYVERQGVCDFCKTLIDSEADAELMLDETPNGLRPALIHRDEFTRKMVGLAKLGIKGLVGRRVA